MYQIKTIKTPEDYKQAQVLEIKEYAWGCEYRPKTYAQLVYIEDKGFELKMWCYEESPRAVYHGPNDKVYTDSCMEAFINFYPQMKDKGYISYEMNANGAALSSFGEDRLTREFVLDLGFEHPSVEVTCREVENQAIWEVKTFIDLQHINNLYGQSTFSAGDRLKANFYKCGDETEIPHYGSWHPIDAPNPDFHRPECFGELVIV